MTAYPSSTGGPKHKKHKNLKHFPVNTSTDFIGKMRKITFLTQFSHMQFRKKNSLFYFFSNYKLSIVNTTLLVINV